MGDCAASVVGSVVMSIRDEARGANEIFGWEEPSISLSQTFELDADKIVEAAKVAARGDMTLNHYMHAYLEGALREAVRQVNEKALQPQIIVDR